MGVLESVFLVMFLLGFLMTLISAVMSGAFGHAFGEGSAIDGGAHPEIMGGDVGHGAMDGHAEVGWAQHDLSSFSPLSPTTISAFLAAAGGTGYIALSRWEWSPLGASLLAVVGGLGFAALVFLWLDWLFRTVQGSSVVNLDSMVGTEAEVSVAIPPGAVGEVTYVRNAQRSAMPARCADGAAVARGARVVVKSVTPTVFVVEETRESWLARTKAQNPQAAR